MGPQGATHCSACPVLCHSESGPLGLSVCDRRAAGSVRGQTACPVCPTLRQSRSRHGHANPLHLGAHLRPSYGSGCMFLFYLLGVGLLCHSIFCQFWLCEEVQCVYLCHHLEKKTLLSLSTLLTVRSFNVLYLWSPIFIYAGILLAVRSAPQIS